MKNVLNLVRGLVCLVCFLGELVLFILIAEIIFKNQDLGMLILCFIACEFILKMLGFNSLVKTCLSLLEKNE